MEQITGSDIRYVAVAVDGAGNEFIVTTEENDKYAAKILKRSLDGTVSYVADAPGAKNSGVAVVCVGADLVVYAGARLGEAGGFPLYRHVVPGVCVPAGSTIPSPTPTPTPVPAPVPDNLLERVVNVEGVVSELQTVVENETSALWNAVQKLRKQTIDWARVEQIAADYAWVKSHERLWVALNDPNDGIYQRVQSFVGTGLENRMRQLEERVDQLTFTVAQYFDQFSQRWSDEFNTLWQRFIQYTDTRLYNVLWDRGVKLLRYAKAKDPDTLPVNDPEHLKR